MSWLANPEVEIDLKKYSSTYAQDIRGTSAGKVGISAGMWRQAVGPGNEREGLSIWNYAAAIATTATSNFLGTALISEGVWQWAG